jgi:pyruvate dehydrogenase E2 component (dihydrolipoamide acetyltransferase)
MATPVEVPKLGNTVEECIVAQWRKRTGDAVMAGDVVAEIETDKATFEVTTPVDGVVLATFFDEGALVPVFTNLFVVGSIGEDTSAFVPRSPGAVVNAPIQEASLPSSTSVTPNRTATIGNSPTAYSPRARRFAEEHNFHPAAVAGSGPGGRILEEDLRALYYSGAPSPRAVAAPAPTPRAATIREKIARRMRESLATTAQYTLNASADARGLISLRARFKAAERSINFNDLITFCTVKALQEDPSLNAEYIDGVIQRRSEIHLGFACDTPRGLLVPVIRNAHRRSIYELASEMRGLAADAYQGKSGPDDLVGATFTISNLGNLGIESFTPLLNPPQVAILGVGMIQLKPVRHNGAVEFIDFVGMSLTCDHQVIDGAPGARFLKLLCEKIAAVESLCTV